MSGVDSAHARRTGGAGFYMHYRDYGTAICDYPMDDGHECGISFRKGQPNQVRCDRHTKRNVAMIGKDAARRRQRV